MTGSPSSSDLDPPPRSASRILRVGALSLLALAAVLVLLRATLDGGGLAARNSESGSAPPAAARGGPELEEPVSAPRVHVEARPVPRAPLAPGGLRFVVLDDLGAPIPDAHVALCNRTAEPLDAHAEPALEPPPALHSRRSGPSGCADFGREPRAFDFVLVLADGHVPLGVPREIESGEQTLVLAGPISIEGRITVAGAEPDAPITLSVEGHRDPSPEWAPIARAELERHGFAGGRIRVTSAADGRFAVHGIPAGHVVDLVAPETHWLRTRSADGPGRRVQLVTTATNVHIDLAAAPVLHATPGFGPHPGATEARSRPTHVLVRWKQTGGSGQVHEGSTLATTAEDLRIVFDEPVLRAYELEFSDGRDHLRSVRGSGRFGRDLELGWIDLIAPLETCTVRVVDTAGRPIEGAKALAGARVVGPAGPDGLLRVPVEPGVVDLAVGAFGYELSRSPWSSPPPATLEVVLVHANRFRLRVSTADGAALPDGLTFALRRPAPARGDEPERFPGFADVHGTSPSGASFQANSHVDTYPLGASGTLEIADLPFDVPLDYRIRNAWGETLTEGLIEIARGATRELEERLPPLLGRVVARVVDAGGQPIAGATVAFDGPFGRRLATDADGTVEFSAVANGLLTFTLSAEGFAHRRLAVNGIPPDGLILLERARVVWIDAIDAAGERIDARIWAEVEGQPLEAARSGMGLYRFDALPESVEFVHGETPTGACARTSITADRRTLTLQFAP